MTLTVTLTASETREADFIVRKLRETGSLPTHDDDGNPIDPPTAVAWLTATLIEHAKRVRERFRDHLREELVRKFSALTLQEQAALLTQLGIEL